MITTAHAHSSFAGPPPMVLANPDIVTVDAEMLAPMPGFIAREYRKFGGEVFVMGKPDPIIYRAALEKLQLRPSEVLMIGDSLEHDIGGAMAAGVDSLFVTGGIHRQDVFERGIDRVLADHGARPTLVLDYLRA